MAGRGPRWPTVLLLVLVVLTFSVVHPIQLIMVPTALLLVGLPPRKPVLLAAAAILAALAFLGAGQDPLWYVGRGWSLLLGGWFILAALLLPARGFTPRALMATAATAATAAVIVAVLGGWSELDWTIASHYRQVAEAMRQAWPALAESNAVVQQAADLPARLFPALLGVASVASLGVAWLLYRAMARRGEPLGRLSEFRFPDGLVWVLIVGLALLVLPMAGAAGWATRVGSNLVFFMGALYALRGLAVLVAVILALVGPQVPVLVVLGVVGVLLYPIVVAGTLLLGVTDTWLDLRSGRRALNDEG